MSVSRRFLDTNGIRTHVAGPMPPRTSGSIRSSNLAADIVGLVEELGKVAVIAAGHEVGFAGGIDGRLVHAGCGPGDVALSAAE